MKVGIIKILAKTRKEKGNLFEEFMEIILDHVGYKDFRRSYQKAGRQIDLRAKHKVTDQPIICECKAHTEKIGSGDINKFYGIYDQEYHRDRRLVGLFFSLSGFTSTALNAYDERDSIVKRRFKLYNGSFILSILREAKMIASDDKLDHILAARIKNVLGKRFLIHTRRGTYWVQLIKTNDEITHYTVLGPQGEEVPTYVCREIRAVDTNLTNLELLDLQARRKILCNLLDGLNKTTEQISKEANESAETVLLSLQDLQVQNLVVFSEESQTYHLPRELSTFVDLARRFLGEENEMEFFLSSYCESMTKTTLPDYIEQRFGLELKPKQKETLLRLITVSPSALHEALFGPTELYKTPLQEVQKFKLPQKERDSITASVTASLLGKLLKKLIVDLEKPVSKTILKKRNIEGYRTRILIALATLDKPYLSTEEESVVMFLPARGEIQLGQLLSVTNFDLFIRLGLIVAHLGHHERAIEYYDRAISNLSDPDKLKAAWNNKGLSLVSLGKYDEAIFCYDRSLELDGQLKEAWYNKGLACALKGDHRMAINCYDKALGIDSNYRKAQEARQKSVHKLEKPTVE